MLRLIPFELGKIWRKKSFLALTAVLLIVNAFMLWYLNEPRDEYSPQLSAYKAVSRDLSGLSDEEKRTFLSEKKTLLSNIQLVEDYIIIQKNIANYTDAADIEKRKLLEKNLEGLSENYEKYRGAYDSGEYLCYTSSLRAEQQLIEEISDEFAVVSGYDEYIKSIEQNKNRLSGISIFQQSGVNKNSFSARNIEKSWLDHKDLNSENIRFVPSRGIKLASRNMITDLFLLLSIMLFVGSLITEEKEKGLFYVTRATKNGIVKCIGAKLAALLIQSAAIVLLLYGTNFIFAEFTAGTGDLGAALQSVSAFQESSLSITLGEFFLLVFFTKTLLLFTFGAALTAISIVSSRSFVPQLCGVGFLGISYIAFRFIPAYSKFNTIKYLSFWGIFDPKYIFCEYLNFNIGDHPVSRTLCAVTVCAVLFFAVTALCVLLFAKGRSLEVRRIRIALPFPFKPFKSLLVHESGKILFTSKAVVVLLIFGFLLGYNGLQRSYYPTVGEQYYAELMHRLEGSLDNEKEQYILSEKARYENAFAQIELIDQMQNSDEIDSFTASSLRTVWEAQTVLYPYFERVEERYDFIKENGGEFVYETGYSLLFGKIGGGYLTDMLLQILCAVFAFSNVMSMENKNNSWNLLSATAKGKREIIVYKIIFCGITSAVIGALPWIFRTVSITKTFTLNLAGTSVQNLPMYAEFPISIPIRMFIVFAVCLQIISIMIAAAVVLAFSYKFKSNAAAIFGGLLVLAVPPALAVMGMDAAKWFSVYPIYDLPALI